VSEVEDSVEAARAAIHCGLALLYTPGDVIELRCRRKNPKNSFNPIMVSGFFDNLDALATAIYDTNLYRQKNGKINPASVWVTLNPLRRSWQGVNNRVYAGRKELQDELEAAHAPLDQRLNTKSGSDGVPYRTLRMTGDQDVSHRRWILIDVDAGQPKDYNSNATEKEQARELVDKVVSFLKRRGLPKAALCDSGNGWHILLRVDLPNTLAMTDIVRRFLGAVSDAVGTAGTAKVDTGVYAAGQVIKAYGSINFKSIATPSRPNHHSLVVSVPRIETAPLAAIQAVADSWRPAKVTKAEVNIEYRDKQIARMLEFLTAHDVEFGAPDEQRAGQYHIGVLCPNVEAHTTGEKGTIVTVSQTGYPGFSCRHAHCQDIRWAQFEDMLVAKWNEDNPGQPAPTFYPVAYLERDTIFDQPQPQPPVHVQESIFPPVQAEPDNATTKANALVKEMLPSVGSRVLRSVLFAEAGARGIPQRVIQRNYARWGLLPWDDGWIERRAPGAHLERRNGSRRRGRPRAAP
jgi:hypothetical protein